MYIYISLVKQPIFGLLYFGNILRPYPMCCSRIIISSHGCVSHPICVVQPAVILICCTNKREGLKIRTPQLTPYFYIYNYILCTHRYGTTTHILQVNQSVHCHNLLIKPDWAPRLPERRQEWCEPTWSAALGFHGDSLSWIWSNHGCSDKCYNML